MITQSVKDITMSFVFNENIEEDYYISFINENDEIGKATIPNNEVMNRFAMSIISAQAALLSPQNVEVVLTLNPQSWGTYLVDVTINYL
ncbi:UNVERIFIED_ORG: hypothetical protein M2414_005366 [Rahnella aquatilis]